GNPQYTLKDQGVFDSGCSRHMTRNKSFLTDYQEIDRRFVAFRGSPNGVSVSVLRSKANEARIRWPDSSDNQWLLLVVQYAHNNQYFRRKMIRSPHRLNLARVHRLIRRRLNVVTRQGHGAVTEIHMEIRGKWYGPVMNNAQ
nr:hypothetical protein [Tanacetum cinerariifolium]